MVIYQNKVINSLSGDVFSLDVGDFTILYNFAIKGESTRHSIITTQNKKTVSKKIDNLHKNGFLKLRKTTPFQNQPHKSTKFFGLSLKGFLASLHYCKVEENYLTKKYLKGIKNKKQSKLILCYLKNDLLCFFTYNSIRGITLNKMNHISDWFENYDSLSGFTEYEEKLLKELVDKRDKSWDNLDKLIPKKSILGNYVDTWYFHMDDFTDGLSFEEIIKNMGEPLDMAKPLWEQFPDSPFFKSLKKLSD